MRQKFMSQLTWTKPYNSRYKNPTLTRWKERLGSQKLSFDVHMHTMAPRHVLGHKGNPSAQIIGLPYVYPCC